MTLEQLSRVEHNSVVVHKSGQGPQMVVTSIDPNPNHAKVAVHTRYYNELSGFFVGGVFDHDELETIAAQCVREYKERLDFEEFRKETFGKKEKDAVKEALPFDYQKYTN